MNSDSKVCDWGGAVEGSHQGLLQNRSVLNKLIVGIDVAGGVALQSGSCEEVKCRAIEFLKIQIPTLREYIEALDHHVDIDHLFREGVSRRTEVLSGHTGDA